MTGLSLDYALQTPADLPAIRKLEERAFGPGRFAKTAYRLREGVEPDWSLSISRGSAACWLARIR